MKKFLLPILGLFLVGCSVENDDLPQSAEQSTAIDALQSFDSSVYITTIAADICGTYQTYKYGDAGFLNVYNTADSLYITIVAAEGNQLTGSNLHLADDVAGFPTVGRGNLPPGQMDHKVSFSPNVESHTFSFSLIDLNLLDGCVNIASNSVFSNGGSLWAGNLEGSRGNWSYLEYCLQTCAQEPPPVCGNDVAVDVCLSTIDNPTLQGFRAFFRSMIFLHTDLPSDGTFNPTMPELLAQFNASDDGTGIYQTEYTVTTVGCGEVTVTLTATVIYCD